MKSPRLELATIAFIIIATLIVWTVAAPIRADRAAHVVEMQTP